MTLRLQDGRDVALDRDQLDRADLHLASVQRPFPSQGQTSDTAHLVVAEHVTHDGRYVAITRARQRTHIYAATDGQVEEGQDHHAALADQISRTEPEAPSIDTPLLREQAPEAEQDRQRDESQPELHADHSNGTALEADLDLGWEL